jgi:hypothetical protein
VAEQTTLSKAQLLEALRSSQREVVAKLGAFPAEEFERGRYEDGWNGRQILAHIASIEWTYPRLIDVAREAGGGAQRSADPPQRRFRSGYSDYNQRQVEKRANASVEELLAEFRQNRDATIAAVEDAPEELFATPIRSAGGVTGPLASVFYAVAVLHVQGHVNDIIGG